MPVPFALTMSWIATAAAAASTLAVFGARRRDRAALGEAAAARSSSEARLRALVDRAAYGIYTAVPCGRLVDANAALAAMLGYDTVDALLGTSIADVYADAAERDRVLAAMTAGTLPDWVEVGWRRRDGTPISVRLSARVACDRAGRMLLCEAIVEDVTMRRRREEAQRRSERLAALGRMLAGTAHELNNPLAAISGFSQLMLRGDLPEDVRQGLETIDQEANRAAAVVKDLLAFSRGPEGGASGEGATCDVNAVARYVARTRRYSLETRGMRLQLALADDPLPVAADRAQVEQVLLNLVTNAEHAIEGMLESAPARAAEQPRIVVRTTRGERFATLEVADDGPGIPPADLPLIWDPFWTTKRDGEGTGLGLPIVHEIVSRLGGTVDVESAPGAGARFRVALPPAAPRAAGDGAGGDTARRPLDVLIADPDDAATDLLGRLLARRGHATVAAPDAQRALALAAQGFDVVVIAAPLAAKLADGDARPLLERLRALPAASAARIVLVTDAAHAADDDAASSVADHADAVVGKPFDIERLRRSIEGE